VVLFKRNANKSRGEVCVSAKRQRPKEVIGSHRQAKLLSHLIDVLFTIAGSANQISVVRIVNHMFEFMQHTPTDIKRRARLLVSRDLFEVGKSISTT